MSTPNDCLQSLSMLQLPENDLKSACVTCPSSLECAFTFIQINGNRELASNQDDFNDNIQVMPCHLLQSLPTVPQLKNYETNRHHTHPLRRLQLNHLLIIVVEQVQAT